MIPAEKKTARTPRTPGSERWTGSSDPLASLALASWRSIPPIVLLERLQPRGERVAEGGVRAGERDRRGEVERALQGPTRARGVSLRDQHVGLQGPEAQLSRTVRQREGALDRGHR